MSRIMASLTMVSETSGSSSYSLASRRQRPSQPSVLSASQRRGTTAKPSVPARRRMTTKVRPSRKQASRAASRPVVHAVGEHDLEPRVEPLQLPQQVAGAVRVLDVGGVDDHAQQQARGVDRDVPLAALDLLGRVVAARPPFSVVLTLWVSMMAAVGLGSRPARSRSIITRWWRIVSHTSASAKARM